MRYFTGTAPQPVMAAISLDNLGLGVESRQALSWFQRLCNPGILLLSLFYGNTTAAAIAIALSEAMKAENLRKTKPGLLASRELM